MVRRQPEQVAGGISSEHLLVHGVFTGERIVSGRLNQGKSIPAVRTGLLGVHPFEIRPFVGLAADLLAGLKVRTGPTDFNSSTQFQRLCSAHRQFAAAF